MCSASDWVASSTSAVQGPPSALHGGARPGRQVVPPPVPPPVPLELVALEVAAVELVVAPPVVVDVEVPPEPPSAPPWMPKIALQPQTAATDTQGSERLSVREKRMERAS